MRGPRSSSILRREFLKLAGATTTICGFSPMAAAAGSHRVAIVIDPDDPLASSEPVRRAAARLQQALAAKSIRCEVVPTPEKAKGSDVCVVVRTSANGAEHAAESVVLAPGALMQMPVVMVSAADKRGLVYGLLELMERVQYAENPLVVLRHTSRIAETPANELRCVGRYFCSEVEDKPWFYDKSFWQGYLDQLVACRFNRFALAFGLGYDTSKNVSGDYFHLPYPYLVEVPGYGDVRVLQLARPDGTRLTTPVPVSSIERDRNLEALRFIAAETAARGLQFQLGIWTHAYQWIDSPNAYHAIEGLTPETHAAYCRDALGMVFQECPQIQGVTLRVHGESGIPEGSYGFWRTLFEAFAKSGRSIEIDMHAKGVNQQMIDLAAETGMPVKLGAKYSAEHQSLGYHQADIRKQEIPRPNAKPKKGYSVSEGARSFTRYGYADFLREGVRYKLLFRLWPGTQRHLLSADPEMAAAYGRTGHFCGAAGLDICEPLTFKGREGSGLPGGRCAYADAALNPDQDWEKFDYFYRLWGRKLYNPEAEAEVWRRKMRADLGEAALQVEGALANASRVLPLITSAHMAEASNHSYWPELYDNMPPMATEEKLPPNAIRPRCFTEVSSLDPQLFSSIVEHAQNLLAGRVSAKYSPLEVAQWLEDFTAASGDALGSAPSRARAQRVPQFRRIEEDVLIQNGLGAFFAAKLRSGVLYEIWRQTTDADAGRQALAQYRQARAHWAHMAERATRVYRSDITYGAVPIRRGDWADRLPAIDKDIADLETRLAGDTQSPAANTNAAPAVRAALERPQRPVAKCRHTPAASFRPGEPLAIEIFVPQAGEHAVPQSVRLHYRHVSQAERWLAVQMENVADHYAAAIPADYTQSPYALQYYFELQFDRAACFHPALNSTLSNQPYYVLSTRIL